MIKLFLKKCIKFIFPVFLIFTLPFIFLFWTSENFHDIDDVIDEDKEVLIGYLYNESNYKYLKWKTIIKKEKKTIWALGSSRVLQLRKELFNQDFYNAGYTIKTAGDYLTFLNSIPSEKLPDILILGFDQWMFNENWSSSQKDKGKKYWEESFSFYPSIQTILNTYTDLFSNFESVNGNIKLKNTVHIGLNANANNIGFRKDGSMYYGGMIEKLINKDSTLKDYKFKDTKSRIIKGNRKFQFGNLVDETAISNIEKLLEYCNVNKIKVIGFLPPFANDVLNYMNKSTKHNYLNFIYDKLDGSFKRYKYELWDFTNPTTFNSNDTEFLDGFHGGELTYLNMIKYMVDNNSLIKDYIDSNKVNFDYSGYNNQFEIFN